MKKFALLLLLGFFLAGCGTMASKSEFWQHDTMYKNWDHTMYSIFGFRNPTKQTGEQSQEQGWWGTEIPYIPAE